MSGMLIISESSPKLKPSPSANDIRKLSESAKLMGIETHHIPQNFENYTANEILTYIPVFDQVQTAFWIGYIPYFEHYQAVYQALLQKNIRLINSPEEFVKAEEFDKYYPFIETMTCKSIVVNSWEEAQNAMGILKFPVFLKGTIQSLKKWGWKACVATNDDELKAIFSNLQESFSRSLGKVIIREMMNLKYEQTTPAGFPQGREYRIFLLENEVLAYSYYWDKNDSLSKISLDEEKIILDLAKTASSKINTPYIAVDIGQKTSGEWVVIEVGDAQFSGICHISPILLWQKIKTHILSSYEREKS
ncbi:MAG: ATP-grasp domain-containing protein [Verrucomicrobia bacterium]|nr:ATP-grasp domain-containing protein [Cytophagales bacterium]